MLFWNFFCQTEIAIVYDREKESKKKKKKKKKAKPPPGKDWKKNYGKTLQGKLDCILKKEKKKKKKKKKKKPNHQSEKVCK